MFKSMNLDFECNLKPVKISYANLNRPSHLDTLYFFIWRYCNHRSICITKYLVNFLDRKLANGTQGPGMHCLLTIYFPLEMGNILFPRHPKTGGTKPNVCSDERYV